MAHAASQTWENGVMVERAKETNRWRVLPDGTKLAEEEDFTPPARTYKTPVPSRFGPTGEKAVQTAENKAVTAVTDKKPRKRAAKK